jgi:hypothetical protein
VAGYIIEYSGYEWTFGVCAIFFGILLFGVVLLVPETTFRRDAVVLVPTTEVFDESTDPEKRTIEHVHMKLAREHDMSQAHGEKDKHLSYSATHASAEPKHNYIQSLRVFTGRYSYAPIFKIFTRPVILFFYPAVFWGECPSKPISGQETASFNSRSHRHSSGRLTTKQDSWSMARH